MKVNPSFSLNKSSKPCKVLRCTSVLVFNTGLLQKKETSFRNLFVEVSQKFIFRKPFGINTMTFRLN